MRSWITAVTLSLFLVTAVRAGDLDFSDPGKLPPPPAGAAGYPSRAADLDALPGFAQPPIGYGEVAFYWWLGDPLTKERLTWQMDQLKDMGVAGLQVNYAHSDKGGHSYGLTYPSDPPLFSDAWWNLYSWFVKEAGRRGMAASLSDYTLGFGQGWYIDEMLRETPELNGSMLGHTARSIDGGKELVWELPATMVSVMAYRLQQGKIQPDSGQDLRKHVADSTLRWTPPAGKWQVSMVGYQQRPASLDPMHPLSGKKLIEKFFQRFEDHNPGEAGKGLNFFFSDELTFGVSGNLWNCYFADEFRRRKGYDIVPELPALFVDTGPRTPKVRMDYSDVLVALEEENFFRPLFEWHYKRGMLYGSDHGGRGRNITEFGDYFRTQRWMTGTGNDQPRLASDIIKTKVNSSIVHLYERPRVWLEGYYGSGWGTSSAQVIDATFRNFVHGHTLLTFHGLYYSTHGGYWEWAPPCNHFRMPYWRHMGPFMLCAQRLSYLLSQGRHRCDVAIVYPVATVEAGMNGHEAVDAAFKLGTHLYDAGIDFDFMDFESLARARVEDKELRVAGEAYRVLVLPAMRAVRHSTLVKAAEFRRAGGIVLALGAVPEASDRAGRDDPQVAALVRETFPAPTKDIAEVEAIVNRSLPRDFRGPGQILHRKIGPRDVYFVYGGTKDAECTFRAGGKVELWDPWTGTSRPLPVVAQSAEGTRLRLPLGEKEPQLIVFDNNGAAPIAAASSAGPAEDRPSKTIALDGQWQFELLPTLDNRFGDYRWPPTPTMIGAEARQIRYADETAPNPGWEAASFDDSKWRKVTCGFGPQFWKLGPLPAGFDDAKLLGLKRLDPAVPVEFKGKKYAWRPYEFSWRYGVEGDPGHQGYHGLKENITDEFLCLGAPHGGRNETVYGPEPGGTRYYLWTSVPAQQDCQAQASTGGNKPAKVWLNGAPANGALTLKAGGNAVLVRYDTPGRGYFVVDTHPAAASAAAPNAFSPAAFWIWYPKDQRTADRWFRKTFALEQVPAEARLRITCDNGYAVSINGQAVGQGSRWETVQEYDVAKTLRPGRNEIVVCAHNVGETAGLIAELNAATVRVATDASWLSAKTESGDTVAAEQIASFTDSLWYKHPHGPPKVAAAEAAGQPTFQLSPLAMTWHNRPSVLPFDVRPATAKPAGWYRFTAPPGLRAMTIAARGKVQAWADGQPLAVQSKSPGQCDITLASPAAGCAQIALRIEQDRGYYAGATLPEPILLDCGPGTIAAGDWSKIDGLASYSGGAWYRKTVTLSADQVRGRTVLNLGEVVASAEVRVNGQPAGIKLAPPWSVDISKLVKPGENRIEILVCNTLANHYSTIPTHYRGSPVSGLLGPVSIDAE